VVNSGSIRRVAERSDLYPYWPLFGLVVRTPRLELRVPSDDFASLIALIDDGIHDPAIMPFLQNFTDTPPPRRGRDSLQFWWRQRAEWSPDKWSYSGAVFVNGRVAGVQGMDGHFFGPLRSVETGSWLGRAFQGQGLGKEMRQAILHLAFAGLGAEEAHSGAFHDNGPSLATSRSVGYLDNGETRALRRGVPDRIKRVRMDRATWAAHRRDDIEIIGLEACLDMFIDPSGG
jgi:RimJ/RimL family protein N-acetyltransferase